MDITKDEKLDVAYVRLRRGKVAKTVEVRPGILIDLSKAGDVLGIEVLSLAKLAPALMAGEGRKKNRSA